MSHLRFPDDVEYLGGSGNEVRFNVSMPTDGDGHFGRECPDCNQIFRVSADDYDALPGDLTLWCVYCGHSDHHSEFATQQQMERATRAAHDYASQLVGQMLDDTFGGMARRSRNNSFVKTSYRSTPFYPEPLPGINEESLIRERICERCRLHYAVYAEHRFCPVCGPLPAMTVALDAIAADETRLDALANLPAEALRPLRESGVLDRTYADTIENVVGTVETLAEKSFHELVPNADVLLRGRGKIFQRPQRLRGSLPRPPATRHSPSPGRLLGGPRGSVGCPSHLHPQRRHRGSQVRRFCAFELFAGRTATAGGRPLRPTGVGYRQAALFRTDEHPHRGLSISLRSWGSAVQEIVTHSRSRPCRKSASRERASYRRVPSRSTRPCHAPRWGTASQTRSHLD